MKATQKIAQLLTGPAILDFFTKEIPADNKEFCKDQSNYQAAIKKLQVEFKGSLKPKVQEVANAVNRRAAAVLLFSGFLGLQMNLAHFRDPMFPNCTWPSVDYCDYLQTNVIHTLAGYRDAEEVLSRFNSFLTPQQKEIYDAVEEYLSFWDTCGAKLAHYCGYLLGNTLFLHLIPGYCPDAALTLRYKSMLQDYLGAGTFHKDWHCIINE